MSTPATESINRVQAKTNSDKGAVIITSEPSSDLPQNITQPTDNSTVVAIKPKVTLAALDLKQKKYVTARVKGLGKRQAALQAGAKTPIAASKYANRMSKNVNVQQAINNALETQGATPEFAVAVLKAVADQQDEIGARRLAAKDILELHGWRKNERPTVSLTVNNAFFGASRATDKKQG